MTPLPGAYHNVPYLLYRYFEQISDTEDRIAIICNLFGINVRISAEHLHRASVADGFMVKLFASHFDRRPL